MKNTLLKLTAGMTGAGLIIAPITYSAVKTSKTKDYSHFVKAENYSAIKREDMEDTMSYLVPKFADYRAGHYSLIPGFQIKGEYYPDLSKNLIDMGKMEVSKTQTTVQINGKLTKTDATLFQNDFYDIMVTGDYNRVYSDQELEELLSEVFENSVTVNSLSRVSQILIKFDFNAGTRAIAGNQADGVITLTVNATLDKQTLKSRIFYVLSHELMHNENDLQSMKNSILYDALQSDKTEGMDASHIDLEHEKNYAEITNRPGLAVLAESLINHPEQAPSVNNAYLANIPGFSKYSDVISGNFGSEIVHLYTKPQETIVEDMLSMALGPKYSEIVGTEITGLLGSIAYRVSHNVSLINVKNRQEIYLKILDGIYASTGFNPKVINTILEKYRTYYSDTRVTYQENRAKIGFYSSKPLDLKGKLSYTLDGSEVNVADFKSVKTRAYIRTSPFANDGFNYGVYYNQITLPIANELQTKEHSHLVSIASNDSVKGLEKLSIDMLIKEVFRSPANFQEIGFNNMGFIV